jgi:hypothetical protein
MKKYEITATLWRLTLDAQGDEIDRERIVEDVVTATDEEVRAQLVFDFLVKPNGHRL